MMRVVFTDMFGLELEIGDTIRYPSPYSLSGMDEGVLKKIKISDRIGDGTFLYKFEILGDSGWYRRHPECIINKTKLEKLQPSLFI